MHLNQILTYSVYAFAAVFVVGALIMLWGVFHTNQTAEDKQAEKDAKTKAKSEALEEKKSRNRNYLTPVKKSKNKEDLIITDTRAPLFKSDDRPANPLAGFANQPTDRDAPPRPTVPSQSVKHGQQQPGKAPTRADRAYAELLDEDNITTPQPTNNTNRWGAEETFSFGNDTGETEDTNQLSERDRKRNSKFNLPY